MSFIQVFLNTAVIVQFFFIIQIYCKQINFLTTKSLSQSNCCDDEMIIKGSLFPQGYLKSPPLYEELHKPDKSKETIECTYTMYGKPGERIQLFYEDLDMYYPYDIYRFNKIDCRYADSICLKFYDKPEQLGEAKDLLANSKPQKEVQGSFSLEDQHYDFCNCINVSYTPRQILSASHFIKVRFKTVLRSYDSAMSSAHSLMNYRGYLIKYQFTRDFGLNIDQGGEMDKSGDCKIYYSSDKKRNGYFSSPNYPGLYPRDTECHYYFLGRKNERVQISFHTFDIEGIDMCLSETKSDYIELSNFQNRDRFYARYCGANKPGTVTSDGSFFHVTFMSNNIFDGKGFQASYYFINTNEETKNKIVNKKPPIFIPQVSTIRNPYTGVDSNGVKTSVGSYKLSNSSRIAHCIFIICLIPFMQVYWLLNCF